MKTFRSHYLHVYMQLTIILTITRFVVSYYIYVGMYVCMDSVCVYSTLFRDIRITFCEQVHKLQRWQSSGTDFAPNAWGRRVESRLTRHYPPLSESVDLYHSFSGEGKHREKNCIFSYFGISGTIRPVVGH